MPHREEGEKARLGQVVRGIHHEREGVERLKYREIYK
jgi:hypothetical protein